MKRSKIIVEGIQVQKLDGSKVNFPLKASNLQIVELNLDDKKRFGKTKTQNVNKKTEIKEKATSKKNSNNKKDSKELNKQTESSDKDKKQIPNK